MTVIEFYDKTSIENVLSALLCQPDRVIFVGDSTRKMQRSIRDYQKVLQERGIEVELSCKAVKKNDLQSIFEELSKLVEKYDDCVLNLDGGEDLCLVAVGMLVQKYPGRLQLHRFNIRSNTIVDCDADGNDQLCDAIAIRIEENARIYGGRVIYNTEHPLGTFPWVLNAELCQDIRTMWRICSINPRQWNYVITLLGRLCTAYCPETQDVKIPATALLSSATQEDVEQLHTTLDLLNGFGLIHDYEMGENGIRFRYKNSQIHTCLSKAGTLLELYIATVARDQFKDDERIYHDVMVGVLLGWNSEEANMSQEVTNEVDVILMHGAVPVFISCKNGDFEKEELFKLYTVAQNFGGKYAKMVLVATSLEDLGPKGEHIRRRAAELNIRVVEDLAALEEEELGKILRNLWCGV